MNHVIRTETSKKTASCKKTATGFSAFVPCGTLFVPKEGQSDEPAARLQHEIERLSRRRTYRAGDTIISEGESMDFVGRVASGVLRVQRTMPDGRQQIVGLLFPSDEFGRVFSRNGHFAVEAATDASVCCFERKQMERLLLDHPVLEHQMYLSALDQLDKARDWMVVLRAHTVPGRIAGFLQLLSQRQSISDDPYLAGLANGSGARLVEIPISRRDIAACLGTTVESLCRTLRKMEDEHVIRKRTKRYIEILDMQKLSEMEG